jgi:pimeloyl-ACP methyl ester carboxylesterase
MSTRFLTVSGTECRIWEQGEGPTVGVLGGLGGVPRWFRFLELLAERHRVVVLSPPGFPGSGAGHKSFRGYLDWISGTLDLIEEAGLEGADLIGMSVGGLLAADAAAFSRGAVGRLVLIGPFGLYDVDDPGADPFAAVPTDIPGLRTVRTDRYGEVFGPPAAPEEITDWVLALNRAEDAAARILWPFGDRGVANRLHRVRNETLILWGAEDRILPPSYAERFASMITGTTRVEVLPAAGHLAVLDQPDLTAEHVLRFLGS